MVKRSSLSVVVPALNEEANIAATVQTVTDCVSRFFDDWEILIFNDGSTDQTGPIADRIAKENPRVKVTHHKSPRNLGACYRYGVAKATKDYVIMIPGDNECGQDVMENIFEVAGEADMIIPYTSNSEVRPWGRRVLSHAFVVLTNIISGCHIRYYNGAVLHKTALVKKYGVRSDGFGYQAELLVRMLRDGISYREVGTKINYRPHGRSKALRPDNIIKVAKFLGDLLVESRLCRVKK